ncbi:hypothetical protein TrLO_g6896 [Triparma laevis f. longispina]|uniref:START domain-containing protein n=1 Tax=Triparma laevis f. longispina TaxID=1714387 RepID=A0A9W7BZF2_9STRA|nr:hypothetical protein TrLO_g6896 [Triparma laevis f. longispina]
MSPPARLAVVLTLLLLAVGVTPRRRGYTPTTPQPWSPTLIRTVLDTHALPYSAHDDKEIGDLVARVHTPLPPPKPKSPPKRTDDTNTEEDEEADMRPFLPHMMNPSDFPKIVDVGRAAKSSVRVLTRRAKSRVITVGNTVSNAVVSGGESLSQNLMLRRGRRGSGAGEIATSSGLTDDQITELLQQSAALYKYVSTSVFERDEIWEQVNVKDGVTVWRTHFDIKRGEGRSEAPIIKARTVMDKPPAEVFALFCDDERVAEYNDNCQELEDLIQIHNTENSQTKLNWCATGRFGPFKARDFLTMVHNQRHGESDGYSSVACNVELDNVCPKKDGYVRSAIELSASFMRPVPGDPSKTEFIQITQIGELGGVADSSVAKKLSEKLVLNAPVDFLSRFNQAVCKAPIV